ncbi:hypothetical protein V5799_030238 [Amblyomma americanum]|uniref:Uncharacterized protein n=1 Tax=Amblyomma americanum TaxID=6943 RepID=A0AAQ4ENT0_AMBAM
MSVGLRSHTQWWSVGNVQLELVLCLGLMWALLYVCLASGLRTPVWTRAVEQVLFTFGVSYGPVITFGSFCRRFENVHSTEGSVSGSVPIAGQSVIFVAMSKYSVHWIPSCLFFLLTLIAGTNSQLCLADVALTHWGDSFSLVQRYRRHFTVLYCLAAFTLGLPFVTEVSMATSLVSGCSSLRLGPIQFPVHVCYVGWSLVIVAALQVPLWAVLEAIRNQAVRCLAIDTSLAVFA